MNRRNLAFTVVEILVVISIILILVGMILLGVRKVNQSSRSNSTKVTLEQCRSMTSEYGRAQGLPLPSEPLDLRVAPDSTVIPLPTTAVLPYWPGDLRREANSDYGLAVPNGRYGVMVRFTSAVMARMMQAPAIRSSVQALPANSLLIVPPNVTMPGAPGFAAGTFYPTQVRANPGQYMCMTRIATAPGAIEEPGVGSLSADYWLDLSIAQAVLQDGFGNPLLYFPTCGFVFIDNSGIPRWLTSAGTFTVYQPDVYWTFGRTYTANVDYVAYPNAVPPYSYSVYKCIGSNTAAAGNDPLTANSPNWVRVATVPFFASAGSDGVFFDPSRPATMDDNMYSFEN